MTEQTSAVPAPTEEHSEGISIIIPAYNEEKGIAGVLQELLESLDGFNFEFPTEIIVVNDGSKDNTSAEIEPFLEGGRIRLIVHPVNRGYGAALKTGISQAHYPWILITDADGTYPNEFIADLVTLRDEHDMVVGARTGENTNIPLIRRPPKWVLRKLASVLSGQSIPDLNSGLRLMRRRVLEKYLHLLPEGFSFTTTITLAMFSAGHRVVYTPIDYHKRKGSSKIRPIADTLNFLKLIFRTVMYFDPLRVFIPVAGVFFAASLLVGFGSFFFLEKVMDMSTVLLFVTGVHMLALGMIADTLNRRIH